MKTKKTKTVLVVEKSAATCKFEKQALTKAGLAAQTTTRIDKAVALLQSESFLIALLDHQVVPWAILEAADSARPRIPVVIVTAPDTEPVEVETLRHGMYYHIKRTDTFYDQLPKIVQQIAKLAEVQSPVVQRLAPIIDSSSDTVIKTTLDAVITTWNKGAERLYGYSALEAIGKPISILIPPDRRDELAELLQRLKSGENVEHFETQRRRKNGAPVHVSLTISPLTDGAGRIVGFSSVTRDITERKYSEDALKAKVEELEKLNEIMMGREERIIELKNELAELRARFAARAEEFNGLKK